MYRQQQALPRDGAIEDMMLRNRFLEERLRFLESQVIKESPSRPSVSIYLTLRSTNKIHVRISSSERAASNFEIWKFVGFTHFIFIILNFGVCWPHRTWDLMLRPLFCQLISLVAIHKGIRVQVNICLYVIVIGSSNWNIFFTLIYEYGP